MERKSVVTTVQEAAAKIENGMTVAIGGFISSNIPMVLIREMIRNKTKNLTIVAIPAGLEIDLLLAAGCVGKLIVPYVGAEAIAPISPIFRQTVEKGQVEVMEVDSGIVLAGLKAGVAGLPFMPWRGGVGTSLPELNPTLKVFNDPINGEPLLAVPAIVPDVAFLHAAYADKYGNVAHYGTTFMDKTMAGAAETTVVQVEQIIPHEFVMGKPNSVTIPNFYVDRIVKAPYGSHPYASEGFYSADIEHLQEYLHAVKSDDPDGVENYLNKYVTNLSDHEDYLETIGIRKLLSLAEF
ncbi:hypothetical protein MFMK1_002649 [Metallumcola ferriviriculae]|uniref:CoA transferase subunit A n=1 Tax=Metallumcola ferriviriculae TaxID=3039180 RepID=A0AAU0UNA5_9FIRM|nr:hypothetical protein MFMK1_002649 [Desulfitibacteraceae bacterium MK1]